MTIISIEVDSILTCPPNCASGNESVVSGFVED